MEKVRKLIDLDKETLEILNAEAKNQNRSLKNLLESTLQNEAQKLATPSPKYQKMMDEMLERVSKGDVEFTPVSEIKKQYGL
ncbi:hypothetical protein SAMN06296241_0519 [Salinimicrobium sediminis]|uniref:Uncharacterized protein n=1 Tax=Salinimicrobium sediminis TaxID=1343891 RepID=A0A285X3P8_9FLAO|nr:hypothetical protein [Salinimicrobium sediminis]SOC78999.1 hypothetical protein SAMN06296241_0519 [Salinimicrobium sediminis]